MHPSHPSPLAEPEPACLHTWPPAEPGPRTLSCAPLANPPCRLVGSMRPFLEGRWQVVATEERRWPEPRFAGPAWCARDGGRAWARAPPPSLSACMVMRPHACGLQSLAGHDAQRGGRDSGSGGGGNSNVQQQVAAEYGPEDDATTRKDATCKAEIDPRTTDDLRASGSLTPRGW